jgi:L-glyceraldehyde 3-phosphate reductase
MALAWVLRQGAMTSALVGASQVEQIEQCVGAVNNLAFAPEELQRIDGILAG